MGPASLLRGSNPNWAGNAPAFPLPGNHRRHVTWISPVGKTYGVHGCLVDLASRAVTRVPTWSLGRRRARSATIGGILPFCSRNWKRRFTKVRDVLSSPWRLAAPSLPLREHRLWDGLREQWLLGDGVVGEGGCCAHAHPAHRPRARAVQEGEDRGGRSSRVLAAARGRHGDHCWQGDGGESVTIGTGTRYHVVVAGNVTTARFHVVVAARGGCWGADTRPACGTRVAV